MTIGGQRHKEMYLFLTLILLGLGYHYFTTLPNPETSAFTNQQQCQNNIWKDLNFAQDNLKLYKADDPRLIQYVQYRYLTPPSTKAYNMVKKNYKNGKAFSTSFSAWVRTFFKDMRNGIFIEAGANKGERGSHTLELEIDLDWTGILVECNPLLLPDLRAKHRKSWIAGVCLSTTEKFAVFNFSNAEKWSFSGRLGKAWNLNNAVKTNWTYFDVESVPFYSIIAAVGYNEIDYLNLDVEGSELDIIRNFPFDKIIIKVIIIEIYFFNAAQKKELRAILESHGYTIVKRFSMDWALVHKSAMNQTPK